MKNAIFAVLLLFLAGCASTTQIATKKDVSFTKYSKIYLTDFPEDPRDVLPAIQARLGKLGFEVIVAKADEPVGGYQGTGFIITSDGYVLTAAHVVGKQKEATLWLNGKRYEADLVYKESDDDQDAAKSDSKNKNFQEVMNDSLNSKSNRSIYEEMNVRDMALLKIKSPDQKFMPISLAGDPKYQMGQDVYTIGFPLSHILGDSPRLNKGLVSSTVGAKDNPDFIQISVEVQPGNSGGPLLNEKGQLVGMILMTLDSLTVLSQTGGALPQNVNFAIKNDAIRNFLKNIPEPTQLSLKEDVAAPFGDIQNSVVQIRSGIIPENFKDEPKLVCNVSYATLWDLWYRFSVLDIIFYDLDTQEVLLRAGQYGDNPFSSETGTLDNVFKEIAEKMGR